MKTYKIETRDTPIGKVDYHLIECAGSCHEYNGEVEIHYSSHCGNIINGVSIGGVIFNKEDILEIARIIRTHKLTRGKKRLCKARRVK